MFHLPNRLTYGHTLAVSHPAAPHAEMPAHRAGTRERTLLDLVMPEYHFRGGASVAVDAAPGEVLRALDKVTLADMPLAYAIGTLRYLPGRLLGKHRPSGDQLTQPFLNGVMPLRLGEDPGREIVIGTVGSFHNPLDPQFVVLPDLFTFTRFNDAAYQKLAIGFRAVPEGDGTRTILSSDHRTQALSASSRRRFALSWYPLVGWGGNVVLRQLLKAVKRRAEADHRAAGSAG